MSSVDERIVEMQFDNQQFEKGIQTSLQSLDMLKKGLEFKNIGNGFEAISKSAGNVNLNGLTNGLNTVSNSILDVAANAAVFTTVARYVNQAESAVEGLIRSMTVDQLAGGWDKYNQKVEGVQTIIAATGASIETVNTSLEKLQWFTDETSYNYTDMVSSIGKFTSAGLGLDECVTAMEGIANWAALSGTNAQKASSAYYNLSQAISTGALKLQDYKSIQNIGMDTQNFRQAAIEAAVALGTLKEAGDGVFKTLNGKDVTITNFTEELSQGWLSKEVMMEVFKRFGSYSDSIYEFAKDFDTCSEAMANYKGEVDELSMKSFKAAQEAKTFADAIDATKDAVSSGWMETWEIIFGNYEEAKVMWTDLANTMWDVFASGGEARNDMLRETMTSGWDKLMASISGAGIEISDFNDKLEEVIKKNSRRNGLENLIKEYGSLENAFRAGAVSGDMIRMALDELQGTVNEIDLSDIKEDISMGETSDNVKKIQESLEKAGYHLDKFGADGIFGSETKEMLEAFQKAHNLEVTGIVDQATIDALIEANAAATSLTQDVYDLIDGIRDLGGRELILQSLSNIWGTLTQVSDTFHKAMKDIFPPMTAEKLYDMIGRFEQLTENISLSDETIYELRWAFDGILSVFDVAGYVVGTLAKSFWSILKFMAPVGKAALKLASNVGKSLTRIRNWIKLNDYLGKSLKTIGNTLVNNGITFKNWISKILSIRSVALPIDKVRGSIDKTVDAFKTWMSTGENFSAVTDGIRRTFQYFKMGVKQVGIAIVTDLSEKSPAFKSFVGFSKSFSENLRSVFNTDFIKVKADQLKNIILGVWNNIKAFGASIKDSTLFGSVSIQFETFKNKWGELFEKIKQSNIYSSISGVFDSLKEKVSTVFSNISRYINVENIKTSFDEFKTKVSGFIGDIPSNIYSTVTEKFGEWEAKIKEAFSLVTSYIDINDIQTSFTNITSAIASYASGLPARIYLGISTAIANWKDKISEVFGKIASFINVDNVKADFETLKTNIVGYATEIPGKIYEGIRNAFTVWKTRITGIFENASTYVNTEKLPTIFANIATAIVGAIVAIPALVYLGIKAAFTAWKPFITGVFEKVSNYVDLEGIKTKLTELGTKIAGHVSEIPDKIVELATTAFDGAKSNFEGLFDKLPGFINVDGIKEAIGNIGDNVSGYVSGIPARIYLAVSNAITTWKARISGAFEKISSYIDTDDIGVSFLELGNAIATYVKTIPARLYLAITSTFAEWKTKITEGFSKVSEYVNLENIEKAFSDISTNIAGYVSGIPSNIAQAVTDALETIELKFEEIKTAVSTYISSVSSDEYDPENDIFTKIGAALRNFANFINETALSKIFNAIEGFINSFKESKLANINLLNMASDAFAVLGDALNKVVSSISIDKLIAILGTVWGFLAKLESLSWAKALSDIGTGIKSFGRGLQGLDPLGKKGALATDSIADTMLKLAESVMLFALAVSTIGNMRTEDAIKGLLACAAALGAFFYFSTQYTTMLTPLSSLGTAFLSFSVGLLAFAGACIILGNMDLDQLITGIVVLGGCLWAFCEAALFLQGTMAPMVEVGLSFLAFSAGLLVFSFALGLLNLMFKEDPPWVALGIFAATLTAFVIAARFLNGVTVTLGAFGAGMLAMSFSMLIFAGALALFNKLDFTDTLGSLVLFFGALFAAGKMAVMFPELAIGLLEISGAILALSVALGALGLAIKYLTGQEIPDVFSMLFKANPQTAQEYADQYGEAVEFLGEKNEELKNLAENTTETMSIYSDASTGAVFEYATTSNELREHMDEVEGNTSAAKESSETIKEDTEIIKENMDESSENVEHWDFTKPDFMSSAEETKEEGITAGEMVKQGYTSIATELENGNKIYTATQNKVYASNTGTGTHSGSGTITLQAEEQAEELEKAGEKNLESATAYADMVEKAGEIASKAYESGSYAKNGLNGIKSNLINFLYEKAGEDNKKYAEYGESIINDVVTDIYDGGMEALESQGDPMSKLILAAISGDGSLDNIDLSEVVSDKTAWNQPWVFDLLGKDIQPVIDLVMGGDINTESVKETFVKVIGDSFGDINWDTVDMSKIDTDTLMKSVASYMTDGMSDEEFKESLQQSFGSAIEGIDFSTLDTASFKEKFEQLFTNFLGDANSESFKAIMRGIEDGTLDFTSIGEMFISEMQSTFNGLDGSEIDAGNLISSFKDGTLAEQAGSYFKDGLKSTLNDVGLDKYIDTDSFVDGMIGGIVSTITGKDSSEITEAVEGKVEEGLANAEISNQNVDLSGTSSTINTLNGITLTNLSGDAEQINALYDALNKLTTINPDTITNIATSLNTLNNTPVDTSSATKSATDAVDSFNKAVSDSSSGVESNVGKLAGVVSSALSGVDLSTNATSMISTFVNGLGKTDGITQAGNKLANSLVSSVKSGYSQMFGVGSYLDEGLARGITNGASKAIEAAKATMRAAVNAAKQAADINSPSRVMMEVGKFFVMGLSNGIDKFSRLASNSSEEAMSDAIESASGGLKSLQYLLGQDIDTNPTIRPVLDLSEIQTGASMIGGMLSDQSVSFGSANLGNISAMMNARNQNAGNDDVVSAIADLGKRISGMQSNTYNVNGITYDDGSNIVTAVKSLVHAARMERRI